MSPNDSEAFESCWPQIAHDLDLILMKRGIEPHTREDLIQETALRLLSHWDRLDKTRPVIPLAATIALNLMRDGFRRAKHEVISDVESSAPAGDVEYEGLARLELSRVAQAMKRLSPSHRRVLLSNVSDVLPDSAADLGSARLVALDGAVASATIPPRSAAATKMLRMRARRRLATLLESAGIVVASIRLRLHQLFNEPAQGTAAALGAGAMLVTAAVFPPAAAPPPLARPEHRVAPSITLEGTTRPLDVLAPRADGVDPASATADAVADDHAAPIGESEPNAPAEPEDEPEADADADVQVDPDGETVARADAEFVSVEIRRSSDEEYSACLWADNTSPPSERCDRDEP